MWHKMRPANQTLALSVAAIVVIGLLRIVVGIGNYLFARQGDPTIWDTAAPAVSWLLWLTLAIFLGGSYCIRASVAAFRSRALPLHTGAFLGVAWVLTVILMLALVYASTNWRWLQWAARSW